MSPELTELRATLLTPVEEASERYMVARRELVAASVALRSAIADETKVLSQKHKRPRRSWEEASELASRVQQFHREHPIVSQRRVGLHFGISRDLVSYYLSPKCKRAV